MNIIAVLEITSNRVTHYEARIQVCGRFVSYSSMSEAGVRTWLSKQGIPFNKQPDLARG